MGFLRTAKRVTLAGILLGTAAGIGDHMNVKDYVFPEKTYEAEDVQSGYFNGTEIEYEENGDGKVEVFLTYENGNNERESLPIKDGEHGPLVGNADYFWNNLGEEQREQLFSNEWCNLENGAKSGLVENAWKELEPETKYELMIGELENLME
ncbi:MAG: hypothetical protein GY861_06375 [bacterium]|nr:hypothetical protein [bacterium]